MSDQGWVKNTSYAITVNDKVVGFPVCIEARGIMYNADAIEKVTGESFNPADYATLDAFEGLLEKLVAGGMEKPTGIMKEDWSMINAYDYTQNMGMMPVPQNTSDDSNTKLVGGGSKYFFIDSSDNTNDAQRQAAKDFLNWMVNDAEGNAFLTEKCALVPAYSNIEAPSLDPLSVSVKKYADESKLIANYNYCPDDHISIAGALMQKYLADEVDRAGFATELETYFGSTYGIFICTVSFPYNHKMLHGLRC